MTETDRIIALGSKEPSTEPCLIKSNVEGFALTKTQQEALEELQACRGLFGAIGVGHGKSLIALLAGTVLDVETVVIFAPASTVPGLKANQDIGHFTVTSKNHIYSYSALSQAKNTDLLDRLKPGLIVLDEAHRVKRFESARTKRLIRYAQANPSCRFVALSGTMMNRSIKDYAHLMELALRDKAPVPLDSYHLEAWSECLDTLGRPNWAHWALVKPFCPTANKAEFRARYQDKLKSSPGVRITTTSSIGNSLYINIVYPKAPLSLQAHIETLENEQLKPDGDFIVDDLELARFKGHLASGFWYERLWPNGKDWHWLEARSNWSRFVVRELERNSSAGYDSPLLVWEKTPETHQYKADWLVQRTKPEPDVATRWLSKYLIDFALDWLTTNPNSIIWYSSRAVEEALHRSGLPVFGAGARLPDSPIACAMSIPAHGIGKNLQVWNNQLVLEPPSSGLIWEQLLGRTHRLGQQADEVNCSVIQSQKTHKNALNKALYDAKVQHQLLGNRLKLSVATFTKEEEF